MNPSNRPEALKLLKEIERQASVLHYMLLNDNISREVYKVTAADAVKRIGENYDQLKSMIKQSH